MSSYKQIAKSSGLVAVVSIIQMIFGLLRNKAIAVLLGAKGFGMYGMYQVFIETAISFSSLGLDKSGVRQIAKNNDEKVLRDKTIHIFKKSLVFISLLVAALCALLAKHISLSLFGSTDYTIGVLIACVTVFMRSVSQGQISILNGLRDLRSLALAQIIAAIIGSLSSVLLIYYLGVDGLALSFFSFGLTVVLFSSYFVSKKEIQKIQVTNLEFTQELKALLKLGLGFSIAGIIASLFTYFSRIYINYRFDLETVGIYQACWLISNMYIGIILTAMSVDFMPRLMKKISDQIAVRKMVNEQMEFGTLLAGFGVVIILLFSEIILTLLYSADFVKGESIIRWQVLGVSLRVLGFPLAHSVMAYNKPFLYVIIQGVFAIMEFLLLILFTQIYGYLGLGISYFVGYLFFMVLWYICTRRIFGFKFSKKIIKILIFTWTGILIAFSFKYFFSGLTYYVLSVIFLMMYGTFIDFIMKRFMNISLFLMIKHKILRK